MLVCLMANVGLAADDVDKIKWIAQDYPPYSFVNEQSQKTGILVDMVSAIMKKIGSTKTANDIEIQAFSRSFIRKNNDIDTAFFPLIKTAEREKYFKWIGPIAMDQPIIIAKASKKIRIISAADFKPYNIGGKDGYIGMSLLKKMGVSDSKFTLTGSDEENLQKLQTDKLDLVVCNEMACHALIKKLKITEKYETVYRLEASEMSIAFNKDTSDEIINKVKQALDEVKMKK